MLPCPPQADAARPVVAAFKTFITNFCLVYNVRGGVSLLLRMARVVRSGTPRDLLPVRNKQQTAVRER